MLHHSTYPLNPFLLDGEPVSPIDHGFMVTGGSCPQWTRIEEHGEIIVLTEAEDGFMPESMDKGICYTVYLDQDALGEGIVARQYIVRQEGGFYLLVEPGLHGGSHFITLYDADGGKVMSGGCWTEEDAWDWLRREAEGRAR